MSEARISDLLCPLCEARPLTNWYYECSLFWIADCVSCGTPMVVLREHRTKPEQWIIDEMLMACRQLFDMEKFEVDYRMRQIPNHFHFHLRLKRVKPKEEMKVIKKEEENEKKEKDRTVKRNRRASKKSKKRNL